jgi:HMG (high mobility group) box
LPEKERLKWEKKAEKDKLRYQEEMTHYTPPDPNAPKRNMSAYFLYSVANRADVKTNNPDASFGDIAKIISQQFKALSEKERAKWDAKAEADKTRYQQEMEIYNN